MTTTHVEEEWAIKDGKLAIRLTWYINNKLDHVDYVTDKELF